MGTMTDTHEEDCDQIGPLLRLAGPREAVPSERALRVKTAVRAEWSQQIRARSQRRTISWSLGALAAAALVLVGVRLAVRDDATVTAPPAAIATVETVTGPVAFRIGDTIRAGSVLDTTGGGRAALRLAGGTAVRIDRDTRLQFASETGLVLDQGGLYIDSGAGSGPDGLEVRTRLGVARDIGTRFEVRVDGSAIRVRVRDGLVQLTQGQQSHDAKPGEELTLNEGGTVVRRTVPVFGADWAWAAALAQPFELEGRSLREFLDWVCGENGWQLRFADTASEQRGATTILHGSIQGLTPEEALAAVLATSGVEHRLENGILSIRLIGSEATN
jgi:ferric-dicitrate binding protein FerR (iron transport regulator)